MTLYPANRKRRGDLIVAPFAYGGCDLNSGARLQKIANLVGTDILGMQAIGTGRAVIDLGARRKLQPSNFARTSAWEAERLAPFANDYNRLIGWGDSGRGANIMGMQAARGVFNRLLLRDAINYHAPQTTAEGWRNFIVNNLIHGNDGRQPNHYDVPPPSRLDESPWSKLLKLKTTLYGASEMINYDRLMLSNYTRVAALALAADPHLPIRQVSLTHTFTGSTEQARVFVGQMTDVRDQAIGAISLGPIEGNGYWPSIEEGYHSDLLRPHLAADHLEQTLSVF